MEINHLQKDIGCIFYVQVRKELYMLELQITSDLEYGNIRQNPYQDLLQSRILIG